MLENSVDVFLATYILLQIVKELPDRIFEEQSAFQENMRFLLSSKNRPLSAFYIRNEIQQKTATKTVAVFLTFVLLPFVVIFLNLLDLNIFEIHVQELSLILTYIRQGYR